LLNGEIEFSTPILVPGLSSRAVGPVLAQLPWMKKRKPELVEASFVHSYSLVSGIQESLLVSAYDIKHKLLTDYNKFSSGFTGSRWDGKNLLIIDSGWYEKTVGPPDGPFVHQVGAPLEWELSDFETTIDSLDAAVRAVVVSWDSNGSYRQQIQSAQAFFAKRPRFASTILLKPPGKARFHSFKNLAPAEAANLRAFSIVGVTEKELGDCIMDRLVELARLRLLLTRADVNVPIQVFGGLDPLYTPLYFAAGGEIFDGLGWLRYFYNDGRSYGRETAALVGKGQLSKRSAQIVLMTQIQNLDEIAALTDELRLFAKGDCDTRKLGRVPASHSVGDILTPAIENLRLRLGESDV
jgi:hypothetical protein